MEDFKTRNIFDKAFILGLEALTEDQLHKIFDSTIQEMNRRKECHCEADAEAIQTQIRKSPLTEGLQKHYREKQKKGD